MSATVYSWFLHKRSTKKCVARRKKNKRRATQQKINVALGRVALKSCAGPCRVPRTASRVALKNVFQRHFSHFVGLWLTDFGEMIAEY